VPILKITFRNRKLEKLCNSAKEMQGKIGTRMAEKLQQRLSELAAAETLDDMRHLPAARCHELTGNLKGRLAVDLVHPHRLMFSPYHDPVPEKDDGGLDWRRVTAVCIVEIDDYH
jgi:plasmid maintenance system killer protein